MSTLFLLRHARAAWAAPGERDYDRRLTDEGHAEAAAIGRAMAQRGYRPQRILCSAARRATETWRGVAATLGVNASEALLTDTLYSEDAAGYLAAVRSAGDVASLLIIGHNPMIEDIAVACAGAGGGRARSALSKGFPTAGLAVIGFGTMLTDAETGGATLEDFLVPADI